VSIQSLTWTGSTYTLNTSSLIISQYPLRRLIVRGTIHGVGVAVAVDVGVAVEVEVAVDVAVAEGGMGEMVDVKVAVGGCELCRVMRGDIHSAKSSCELPFVKTVKMNFTLCPRRELRSILTV
jgi:hypothetical protein